MFTYLLLMSWSFFVFGNANFIESRFFWDFSDRHPYLIYNTARVDAILLITYPFILHFLGHTVREALKMEEREDVAVHVEDSAVFHFVRHAAFRTVRMYAYASWQFLISRYLMLLEPVMCPMFFEGVRNIPQKDTAGGRN